MEYTNLLASLSKIKIYVITIVTIKYRLLFDILKPQTLLIYDIKKQSVKKWITFFNIFCISFLLFNQIIVGTSEVNEFNIMTNETAKHRFLFVGASNTEEDGRFIINGSFVTKLRDYSNPWDSLDILNSAISGFKIETMKDRYGDLDPDFIKYYITKYNPNMILFVLGANDFLFGKSATDFRAEYIEVLDFVNEALTGTLFQSYIANIYGVPYWINLSGDDLATANAYQDVIAELSTMYNMPLINFFNAIAGDGSDTLVDNRHLNDQGMVKLAKVVNDTISEDIFTTMVENPLPEIVIPSSTTTEIPTSTKLTTTSDVTSQSNPTIVNFLPVLMVFIGIPILLKSKKLK